MYTTVELLGALRSLGMSQVEIAKQTGIPQPRVSRWMAGDVPASADDALRLRKLVDDTSAGAPRCEDSAQRAAA